MSEITTPTPSLDAAVVIAASAGGVRAVSTLLHGLPRDFPAAVLLVLHRRPDYGSLLAKVLQKHTSLRVVDAVEGDPLRGGTVYVARADRHLGITADLRLAYHDGHRIHHVLSSANPLFESAAAVFHRNAIGVVLTGSLRDGTDGVQAISHQGGVVIAQNSATADYFSMPHSAIMTGSVDFVLPLDEIAPMLVRIVLERAASPEAASSV